MSDYAGSHRFHQGPRALDVDYAGRVFSGNDIPEIPTTSWAVLGLLSLGESVSGYDLKGWSDYGLAFFYWSPSHSQIYGHLRRLEKLGYAISREAEGKDDRKKRAYSITHHGTRALRHWVAHAAVDAPVLKHNVMLRVWAGHLARPHRLHGLVDQHTRYMEHMRQRAEELGPEAEKDDIWAYQAMVLRWAQRYYASQAELSRDLLDKLEQLPDEHTHEDDSPRCQATGPGDKPLPATGWAVLCMLSFADESSGYDLKKQADWGLHGFYWSPSYSQIYSELKRLEQYGYTRSRPVFLDVGLRSKRLYSITPQGRAAAAQWVDDAPFEPPVLKHGVLLRIWLGHVAEAAQLRELLEHHIHFATKMRDLTAHNADQVQNQNYPALVLHWSTRYYETERSCAESLLAEVIEHGEQDDE